MRKIKIKDLRQGDMIFTFVPFEENTKDYHNGYDPLEIRDELVTIKGNVGKSRPLFILKYDTESNELWYVPMTTSITNNHDKKFQYALADNSMMTLTTKTSIIETNQVRRINLRPHWSVVYEGHIGEADNKNIMNRISENTLSKLSLTTGAFIKDEISIVNEKDKAILIDTYKLEKSNGNYYKKINNLEVEIKRDNSVILHQDVTIEQVKLRTGQVTNEQYTDNKFVISR